MYSRIPVLTKRSLYPKDIKVKNMTLHNNMRDHLLSFLFCLQFNFYLRNDTALKDFLDEGNFI